MGALKPFVGAVTEQARQVGELFDDVVNEAAVGVRSAQRLASP